ncbi:TPA: cons domain protein, partial [Escherichia coli]|nr:cons domain protein [Escherichia coli]
MNTLFNQPLKVVNAGLHSFADNIQHAGGHAISLNWQPPAQGDIDTGLVLASLLRHPLVESANQIAMTRYLEAQPVLVDVMLAKEAIPEMAEQKRILHSGPPI